MGLARPVGEPRTRPTWARWRRTSVRRDHVSHLTLSRPDSEGDRCAPSYRGVGERDQSEASHSSLLQLRQADGALRCQHAVEPDEPHAPLGQACE